MMTLTTIQSRPQSSAERSPINSTAAGQASRRGSRPSTIRTGAQEPRSCGQVVTICTHGTGVALFRPYSQNGDLEIITQFFARTHAKHAKREMITWPPPLAHGNSGLLGAIISRRLESPHQELSACAA
ncbi:hypothetical protein [Falsiroseomonas sp.]|uniref:hypothetical protein n=1 Tax=Falsiroseomonas sp. TaxID=2870721 RepID=UPI00273250F5|nr:hypothetical protein [Falsiroseomonas sp.]